MTHKVLVIETRAPTDSDYEYITDTAIQNTLSEYFKWAGNRDVKFKLKYPESDYDGKMQVYAEFTDTTDLAEFKLMYQWDLPKKKLDLSQETWIYT